MLIKNKSFNEHFSLITHYFYYMTVKDRLKRFIEYKKISIRSFERDCGLSYGYVNNIRVSIQPDKVTNIATHFPELNTGWLLTGEGEMLRNDSISQITPQETNSDPATITLSKDILEQVLLNLSETLKSQQEAILNQQITIQKFTTQSLTRQGASGAPEGNVTDASVSGSDLKK